MDTKQNPHQRTTYICAAIVASLVLAGCEGTPAGSATGAPSTPQSPPRSTAAAFHPGDSVSVGCDAARPTNPTAPPPSPANDLVIGPLVYPGLGNGYNFGIGPYVDAGGIAFFKEGTELPADTTVTVSIGALARAWADILVEFGPAAGYSSVTYQSCSSTTRPGQVFWVGGFTLGGKTSACVPLEILVAGESQPRHVVLSLEAGDCS